MNRNSERILHRRADAAPAGSAWWQCQRAAGCGVSERIKKMSNFLTVAAKHCRQAEHSPQQAAGSFNNETAKGCKVLFVDPKSPDHDSISKAAGLIKKGGLVVFPTTSFYGLGADAFNAEAVDKVFRAKKRDPQKPVLILVAHLADLAPLARMIPRAATRLMEAFWPGSLTLVFPSAGRLPSNLTGSTGQIGIRLAGHPVACSLIRAVGSPITGTSANLSGKGGCSSVSQMDDLIKDQVDLVLDAGTLGGVKGSTVVDVTVVPPKILREGVIGAEEIWAAVKG